MKIQPYQHRNIRSIAMLTVGIMLIIIGIVIAVLLIKSQYDFCVYMWNNGYAFAFKYDSAWDCFIERSTGAIIMSIIFGSIPFSIGCFLISRR